jgi:uncharacterized protein (DUF924 family)
MGVSEVFNSLSKLSSAVDLFAKLELFVGESDAEEHFDVVRLRFGGYPPTNPQMLSWYRTSSSGLFWSVNFCHQA